MITSTSGSSLSTVNEYQAMVAFQPYGNSATSSSGAASDSDTVQLSPTAQATAMQQDGMSVTQISSNMGLTTAEVDSYLGITAPSPSVASAPSGGGGGHAAAPSHSAPRSEAAAASGGSSPQVNSSKQTKT